MVEDAEEQHKANPLDQICIDRLELYLRFKADLGFLGGPGKSEKPTG